MAVKPTTILTGFLGSGKTTYLNHLLEQNPNTRYAIIENEYGEQSIDSELIIRGDDDIVELNNGCLCCTLNDNLYDILNILYQRRDEYDEVIIEATGVADPRGLATPFTAHPSIKKQFPLRRIICLVDASLIKRQLNETEEAIHQITFSDVLLVNKTDLVHQSYLSTLVERLQKLNPLALVVKGQQKDFPLIEIEKRNPQFNDVLSNSEEEHHAATQDFPVPKPQRHHHDHAHTDGIVSCTVVFDQPFDYQTLRHRLTVYLLFQAQDLYRMKGLLWLGDSDQQSVGKRLVFEEKKPWKATEKRQSKIVFIGKNIQKEALEKMLSRCLK